MKRTISSVLLSLIIGISPVFGQSGVFTYQGKLVDNGFPANGRYDMRFSLYATADAGSQIGETQTVAGVQTIAGIFTVRLDFGTGVFPGADRFLEISISPGGQDNLKTLQPRQPLTSAPHALRSLSAGAADTAVTMRNRIRGRCSRK
jgi:hypothetical protein